MRSSHSVPRSASIVAFYGSAEPAAFAEAVIGVQADLIARLGAAYLPRVVASTHSTLVGLEALGPLEPSGECGTQLRDTRRADLAGFAGQLRRALHEAPVTVQFGGFPDRDLALSSRGRRLYERSVVADRDQVVLIGWPVDAEGHPLMVLDGVRRAAARYGIEHRYPLSQTAHDPDAHVVVGELVDAIPADERGAAMAATRAALAERPRRVPLGWDDLSIVVYDDTRLPLDTTVTVPWGDLR